MDFISTGWRSQLEEEHRKRNVKRIMVSLKRRIPYSDLEGLIKIKQIAIIIENIMCFHSLNQTDYTGNITLTITRLEANAPIQIRGSLNLEEILAKVESYDLECGSPSQAEQPPPMDGRDWQSQLQPERRQRIIHKILNTLTTHVPFSGEEGLQELRTISARFEEKMYNAASSQDDYLRKITFKLLVMEKSTGPWKKVSDEMKHIAVIEENLENEVMSKPAYKEKIGRLEDAFGEVFASRKLRDALASEKLRDALASENLPDA